MKNTIYVVIIVACLLLACFIAYKFIFKSAGSGSGIESISSEETTWVKCANKECGAEYQMGLKEYHQTVEASLDPMSMTTPPIVCKECDEPSIYRAEKCESASCGIVFFSGAVRGDYQDRCPECGISATEESRKARTGAQ